MRVTATIVRSGQPRAYADTEYVVQFSFEEQPWQQPYWVPAKVGEKRARMFAEALNGSALPPSKSERAHGLDSYLDYIRPAGEVTPYEGENYSPVWEFRIVCPFND